MAPHRPPAEYYASLPKAIAAGSDLFHDPNGAVLLVQPSYRDDTWEIPGGAMDAGEYPWQTARREIREELGLDLRSGRLLAVDWVLPRPDGRPALVHFVFDGGVLTHEEARNSVHLPPDELLAWRFCQPAETDRLVEARVARRIHAGRAALSGGHVAYLQDGHPVNTRG
ncbi:MAG: NUDIX domain-containing protein [Frankia sp.]